MPEFVVIVITSVLIHSAAAYNTEFHQNDYGQNWPHDHQCDYGYHMPHYHHHDNHHYHHRPQNYFGPQFPNSGHYNFQDINNKDYYWPNWNSIPNENEWFYGQTTDSRITTSRPAVPDDSSPSQLLDALSIAQCMQSCPVTPEYNPVCGSNNLQYDNVGRLNCARACGVDVTLMRRTACSTIPDIQPSLNQPTQSPIDQFTQFISNPTTESPSGRPTLFPFEPTTQPLTNRPTIFPLNLSMPIKQTTNNVPPELSFDERFKEMQPEDF